MGPSIDRVEDCVHPDQILVVPFGIEGNAVFLLEW
jgi:hypothetical protein